MQVFLTEQGLLSKKNNSFEKVLFYKGKGCKQCNDSGYKGRTGIYEVMENTLAISDLIAHKATAEEIEKQHLKENNLTLTQDGFMKALQGITAIEEVLRVTQE